MAATQLRFVVQARAQDGGTFCATVCCCRFDLAGGNPRWGAVKFTARGSRTPEEALAKAKQEIIEQHGPGAVILRKKVITERIKSEDRL